MVSNSAIENVVKQVLRTANNNGKTNFTTEEQNVIADAIAKAIAAYDKMQPRD